MKLNCNAIYFIIGSCLRQSANSPARNAATTIEIGANLSVVLLLKLKNGLLLGVGCSAGPWLLAVGREQNIAQQNTLSLPF